MQDKFCHFLTFVGLLAVIGFSSWSLLPERSHYPPVPEPKPTDEAVRCDTLPELPAVPDEPLPATAEPDSLATDSLSNLMEMADTAAAPQPQHPQHTDSTHHHEPRATHQSPTTDHSAPADEAAAPAQ